jgi:3-deoxy-7-phosphoheptulonate synthase
MIDLQAFARLRSHPPLVFAGECDLLTARLARAARGEAFVLLGGDLAWDAGAAADAVRTVARTLFQMAGVLTYAASVPVVRIGRITLRARTPADLVRGYEAGAATVNLMRALVAGGDADPRQVHQRNRDFVAGSPQWQRYAGLTAEIDRTFAFMRACGVDAARLPPAEFFVAHEGLPPAYQSALTRVDARTGLPYSTAGHLVRTGSRLRAHGGGHGGDFAAIRNPLSVALGPEAVPDRVLALLDRLDPAREPGRLTFVVRMGEAPQRAFLPTLVEKVTAEDHQVAWICELASGGGDGDGDGDGGGRGGAAGRGVRHRPRRPAQLLEELTAFLDVHQALGTHPGGLSTDVTGTQALDLAFLVAERYREHPPRRNMPQE